MNHVYTYIYPRFSILNNSAAKLVIPNQNQSMMKKMKMSSSANILPLEIQIQIMKKAPVKSVIRFRSVSKQWKSVIDGSEFINHYTGSQHHLLVTHVEAWKDKFVLIADDDSFPHHKFSPTTVSVPFNLPSAPSMLDCSHGLVCLYGLSQGVTNDHIILWNPAIRKSVGIMMPDAFNAFGFGVCPKTRNPKIVKIRGNLSMDWKAEVFTFTSGSQGASRRSVSMNHLPYTSIEILSDQLVADGVVYWVAFVKQQPTKKQTFLGILSFDLTTEEFIAVDLPDSLAREVYRPYSFSRAKLRLSKLNESLVVLDYCTSHARKPVCDVWKMTMMLNKNGVPSSSFTKLFTLEVKDASAEATPAPNALVSSTISGFRMNGQPIMKHIYTRDGLRQVSELEVYQPGSQRITSIGIYDSVFQTTSYTESLLLLNHAWGSVI